MQIFVQDIREFGFKKIFAGFAVSPDVANAFMERMRIHNILLSNSNCKSTAFSVPKLYSRVYHHISPRYDGMVSFMTSCEPLIMSMDTVDKSVQRRFRNQWNNCWDSFGKSVYLRPETISMLGELGVRMCFAMDFGAVPDEVLNFYNTVLKWYVYTRSDGAVAETGLTPNQLLEMMILQDSLSFIHSVQVGF